MTRAQFNAWNFIICARLLISPLLIMPADDGEFDATNEQMTSGAGAESLDDSDISVAGEATYVDRPSDTREAV